MERSYGKIRGKSNTYLKKKGIENTDRINGGIYFSIYVGCKKVDWPSPNSLS